MAGLERVAGGMRLRLDADEVDVVASLSEGLAARLVDTVASGLTEDDVLDRLAPRVSRGDAEVDAELRAMLRGDLIDARVARLQDLSETLRAGGAAGVDRVLDREQSMRVVEALNDLRLALAATIGYDGIVREELAADDRRLDAVRLMDALAWLQGGLIEFVDTD